MDQSAVKPIPAVILAGSDRKPVPVPPGAEPGRFLVGYKGADVLVGGRPLIQVLRERLLASGGLSPVLVVGPRRVYEPLVPGAVIDTDRDVGQNLRKVFRTCKWAEYLCVVACDVLPTVEDVREALRLWEEAGRPDVWFPIVEVPEELGPSGWKPRYRMRSGPEAPPQAYLPGHIGILRLKAIRRRFLCKLASMLYRLRNRELEGRRKVLSAFIVGDLLAQDFMNLLHFRLPTMTWRALRQGWKIYSKLKKGAMTIRDFEEAVLQVFVRPLLRKNARVVISPTRLISWAKDFDTLQEVRQAGGVWTGRVGGVPSR